MHNIWPIQDACCAQYFFLLRHLGGVQCFKRWSCWKNAVSKSASFLLCFVRKKQKSFYILQCSLSLPSGGGICPKSLPPPVTLPFFLSILQRTALELEWPERDRQLPGPWAPERETGRGRGGDAQILMRCAVSMATLTEEGKKKRVLSLSLYSPLLCAPSSSSFSLLPSSPAGEGLCKAPDDTPDAPTQQPLSDTFTSLP